MFPLSFNWNFCRNFSFRTLSTLAEQSGAWNQELFWPVGKDGSWRTGSNKDIHNGPTQVRSLKTVSSQTGTWKSKEKTCPHRMKGSPQSEKTFENENKKHELGISYLTETILRAYMD